MCTSFPDLAMTSTGYRSPSCMTAWARIRRCPLAIGMRVPRGSVTAITTVSCTCFFSIPPGNATMTRTHYLTRHQQDRYGSPLRSYSLRNFRCCSEPARTSLEGRDEGTAFSCWFGNGRVHDGQRPRQQRSRPRRNMLWPQGRAQMRIPNWLCRRYRRFLCWIPQLESKSAEEV